MVGKTRLRTKFLLSLLLVIAALTTGTLFVVGYSVQTKIRESLRDDLSNSIKTYQTFERLREITMTRSAKLLANLPNVRALMTTQDVATIQDESANIWRLSGSDLLALADRAGKVVGLQTSTMGFTVEDAQNLLQGSMQTGAVRAWWFGGGHLYEVWLQPIYFGAASEGLPIGTLAVGHEIDNPVAKDFSNIAASEVLFRRGETAIAGTIPIDDQTELSQRIHDRWNAIDTAREIQLGRERYLVSTINLSDGAQPAITMSVLKSLDKATAFLNKLKRVLLGLGFLSVLAGSSLVFLVSHTFTRPLSNLVSGVRALEEGDFAYPIEHEVGDEVAAVAAAFARMRVSLQATQKEQKQLEERLRQAHKMEAMGKLAGGVAHDFNNLLTIIRGNGDLLADREGADNFQRRCVEQIQKAADRAVSMTRQLLAFSRMQILQPRVLDLNAIVSEMGKMLPRLIGEHIDYQFHPDVRLAAVLADPGQMEQVVLNLAVNSRDAMPMGGKLTVRTQNVTMTPREAVLRSPMAAGDYVLLCVSDTGQGLDNETRAHIFEPFFTTKDVGKGTGLGLATVYGIIKQSGGYIWVESSPGQGATFEIYFPPAVKSVTSSDPAAKPDALPGGTETVLVVEDEAGVRDLACQFLISSGYSVLQAKDGVEALEIIAGHAGPVHLVVSDLLMPRMGGAELAAHLNVCCPDAKVMFITGYSEFSTGDSNSLSKQNPGVILQKPFSKRSLLEKIRKSLGAHADGQTDGQARDTQDRVVKLASESQITQYPGA
jgi:signal transduction histidine kinase/CheY-like chemotaxis protein